MKKIPTIFMRNYAAPHHHVYGEPNPEAQWVFDGIGVATVKRDGIAAMIREGILYKRYDLKTHTTRPLTWEPCEPAPDPESGHWPGWIPVGDGPEDRWYREAWARWQQTGGHAWTYELVGPHIGVNPYNLQSHILIPHGSEVLGKIRIPMTYNDVVDFLMAFDGEGIVWWSDINDMDCAKAKIKRRDFGLPWPLKE